MSIYPGASRHGHHSAEIWLFADRQTSLEGLAVCSLMLRESHFDIVCSESTQVSTQYQKGPLIKHTELLLTLAK